jgi:hypothetical protein
MRVAQITVYFSGRKFVFREGEQLNVETWTHTSPAISNSTILPSVLLADNPANSISMERALKQIKELLEKNIYNPHLTDEACATFEDTVQASIEDVETMLAAIK